MLLSMVRRAVLGRGSSSGSSGRGRYFSVAGRRCSSLVCETTKQETAYDQEDKEDELLRYDPVQVVVVPSDEEDNLHTVHPDSLVRRLEDSSDQPVLPVLHKWIADGKETPDGIVAAINRLKWFGRYKHALEISDFVMHERRLELQKVHYLNHLELLGRVQSMKVAEDFLRKMPRMYSKTEAAQMIMFDSYIAHGAMHNAKLVLQVLKSQGFLTSPTSFNKLFTLCAKKSRADKIPQLLKDMKQMCIPPDLETYNILIGMKGKNGDTDGMERLFNKMKSDSNAAPNGDIFCTLASGYVTANRFQEASQYLEKVVESVEFRQSRKLHDRVISLHAAMGNLMEVNRVWRFSKRFPVISGNSYISTIAAYEKLGEVDKAEEVFTELEKKRRALTTRHYNALLQVYSERKQLRKAEKLLERMNRNKCRMDNMTYHHLVTGYIRSGNQQMAVETLNKMLNTQIRPSFETMLLVLHVHADRADIDSAEAVFQNMRRECYSRNVEAYNALLKTYIRADRHAYRFLQRMALDKVAPNATTFSMLNKMKPIPKLGGRDGGEPAF